MFDSGYDKLNIITKKEMFRQYKIVDGDFVRVIQKTRASLNKWYNFISNY